MNRRTFFNRLGQGAAVVAVAPMVARAAPAVPQVLVVTGWDPGQQQSSYAIGGIPYLLVRQPIDRVFDYSKYDLPRR